MVGLTFCWKSFQGKRWSDGRDIHLPSSRCNSSMTGHAFAIRAHTSIAGDQLKLPSHLSHSYLKCVLKIRPGICANTLLEGSLSTGKHGLFSASHSSGYFSSAVSYESPNHHRLCLSPLSRCFSWRVERWDDFPWSHCWEQRSRN